MSKTYNHRFVIPSVISIVTIISILFCPSPIFGTQSEPEFNIIENPRAFIKNYTSYSDGYNNTIIVGSVAKSEHQDFPQTVLVGIRAFNSITDSHEIITEKPYNSILYRDNEPFPFKFKINSTIFPNAINSKPFVFKSQNVSLPTTKLNTIELKYPVIPQGTNNELYGNVTNTSPIQLKNITLFAIVNDRNSAQIDSVKTVISNLKPYQTLNFTFIPDPAIQNKVYFYSCVGGDINNMNINDLQIVNISSSKVLGYKFSDLVQIDYLNYNSSSNQFKFSVNNIYPYPGSISLELMPPQDDPLSISIDGLPTETASTRNMDNKTSIELSVPQGKHDIIISNIEE